MPGWPGHTVPRRAIKRVLAPVLNEEMYSVVQAISMARDIRTGHLTEDELQVIPQFVKPGDTALDIGANYGMWTYALSRAVGPLGRVWAFEPIPFTVSTLRKVTGLLRLKNVEIVPQGCGEMADTVEFDVPVQDNGAFSAGQAHVATRDDERPGRERHARWGQSKRIHCGVVAADDVVPESASVTFIKLDIEGAELSALRGCERIIGSHHPIIVCEINPWYLEGLKLTVEDLISFLSERDYRLCSWQGGSLVATDPDNIAEGNYIFVHPRRSAESP